MAVRSPESNGMAESFVKTMKRDHISIMPKRDGLTAVKNLAEAFEHYNEWHPHSALGYRSSREYLRRRTSNGLNDKKYMEIQGSIQLAPQSPNDIQPTFAQIERSICGIPLFIHDAGPGVQHINFPPTPAFQQLTLPTLFMASPSENMPVVQYTPYDEITFSCYLMVLAPGRFNNLDIYPD